MKIPASLADLGIAAAVGWWFRDQPWAALAAVAAVLLWPVTWYVSAWWGQYESIYVLWAVLAVLAARGGLPLVAAALLAVSLMTKPQALPFLVPFAAWFLATQGIRGRSRRPPSGAVVDRAPVAAVPRGRRTRELARNLAEYQNDTFSFLSLRAWNPWWALQELGADGEFVLGPTAVLGPLTFRHLGFVLAGLLSLMVFLAVYRRPSAHRSRSGSAAISLVAFVSPHDDARAVRLSGVRVPAVRPRPARGGRRLAPVRDHVPAGSAGRRSAGGMDDPGGAER